MFPKRTGKKNTQDDTARIFGNLIEMAKVQAQNKMARATSNEDVFNIIYKKAFDKIQNYTHLRHDYCSRNGLARRTRRATRPEYLTT